LDELLSGNIELRNVNPQDEPDSPTTDSLQMEEEWKLAKVGIKTRNKPG